MKVLGCLYYARIVQQDKLQSRKIECLDGFSETQKGNLLHGPTNYVLFFNRDVSFIEDVFPIKVKSIEPQYLTTNKLNDTLSNIPNDELIEVMYDTTNQQMI